MLPLRFSELAARVSSRCGLQQREGKGGSVPRSISFSLHGRFTNLLRLKWIERPFPRGGRSLILPTDIHMYIHSGSYLDKWKQALTLSGAYWLRKINQTEALFFAASTVVLPTLLPLLISRTRNPPSNLETNPLGGIASRVTAGIKKNYLISPN